jgi:hypothetical protein
MLGKQYANGYLPLEGSGLGIMAVLAVLVVLVVTIRWLVRKR